MEYANTSQHKTKTPPPQKGGARTQAKTKASAKGTHANAFATSQTMENVARSFAAESQAGLRYQLLVDMAQAEGFVAIANEVKHLAKNEVAHAKMFFTIITDRCGSVNNIRIDAGYPFEGINLCNALQSAMQQEEAEFKRIYPKFAEVAEKEGFPEIAARFRLVAQVEKQHAAIFRTLVKKMQSNSLYKSEKPTAWECGNCGHTATLPEAWKVCPLCGAKQGTVQLKLPK